MAGVRSSLILAKLYSPHNRALGIPNPMKSNLLYKLFFFTYLTLSAICIVSLHQVSNLVQADFETQKNIEEVSAAYDSLIEKIRHDGASNEQLVEIFESIKESDVSEYEYKKAVNESLVVHKDLLYYILLIQGVIIFVIWRRSVMPNKMIKDKDV